MAMENKMKCLIIIALICCASIGYKLGIDKGHNDIISELEFSSSQLTYLREMTIEGEYNHTWWANHPELCFEYIKTVGTVEHNLEWAEYYQDVYEILASLKK